MSDRFPIHLRHPELRWMPESEMSRRTDFWPRLLYFVPRIDWISWYGDMLREDGKQGMYATELQHAAWPAKVKPGDITIGPR